MVTTIILWGIGINLGLLAFYYFLHQQIEKFSTVREKVLIAVKRSRASYSHLYGLIVLIVAFLFYLDSDWTILLTFTGIALIILIDIHHDGKRLVLTQNALIYVQGFLSTKATTVEYKDLVLIEVFDQVMGRMLGYGDIKVTIGGAGGKQIVFNKIPHYLKIKNLIESTKISQERGRR